MAILAVAGRKGGTGKSTITANLAAEWAAQGRRLVVLDAVPGAPLQGFAVDGGGLLGDLITAVDMTNPAHFKVAVLRAGREADVIIIDTPSGQPNAVEWAAEAADVMVLPVAPSGLDLAAAAADLATIERVRAARGGDAPLACFLPNRVPHGTRLGRTLPARLEALGAPCLPAMAQRTAIAEAMGRGLSMREHAATSTAAAAFAALAQSLLAAPVAPAPPHPQESVYE